MTSATPAAVAGLYAKRLRGEPMEARHQLGLSPDQGVVDDANPAGFSPRQVSIAFVSDLRTHGVTPAGSRANIVLHLDDQAAIQSGTLLTTPNATIRVTMECEPCAHGARLADAPLSRFRDVNRYLGVVTSGGHLQVGNTVRVQAAAFAAAPEGFPARCQWAVNQIPAGKIATSLELLKAVGAGKSYARVLPKWLRQASLDGSPVHRVLTASLETGSWAPHTQQRLLDDGVDTTRLATAEYALSRALWFGDLHDHAHQRPILVGAQA